jgi:hypothetical protein
MQEPSLRLEYKPDLGPGAPQSGDRSSGKRVRSRRVLGFGLRLLALAVAVLLPFILIVRLAVIAYARFELGSWAVLLASSAGVVVLLFTYVLLLRLRFQRKIGVPKAMRRLLVASVAGFVGFTLFYLSGANAKTLEIREAYTELNPLLRLATGTVLLVDREAVVTDVDRTPADYLAWGLSVNEASLHFEQDDGFVHAVDVRTLGRAEWKNRALEVYYRGMGFRTLRHVGTADHLHVSMPGRTDG